MRYSLIASGMFLMAVAVCPAQAQTPAPAAQPSKPAATAATQTAAAPTPARSVNPNAAKINEGLKQLIAEAKELDEFKEVKDKPVFSRPHPAIASWGPDMAVEVLNRMIQPFTGNEYRDTYIRWHLMHVVKKANRDDREEIGARLTRLLKQLPGPVTAKFKPWYRDEPPEISAEWHRLYYGVHATTGYPPFQRDFYGPNALPYITDPAKKAKAEADVAKAEQLRPQWKRITDQLATDYNTRIRNFNWIIRQYRGELLYAMLTTGDPAVLNMIGNEITRQARSRQRIAFDMMSFVYLAAFDGHLQQYEQPALDELARDLESAARSAQGYFVYLEGKEEPPNYYPFRRRNFEDYAFHMINTLREMHGVGVTQSGVQTVGNKPAQ